MSSCLIRSCILLFYISGYAGSAQQPPDALYADRENIASARAAAEAWKSELAASPSFAAAWKLARAAYWLGGHGSGSGRRAWLEAGIEGGRRAIALDPKRPEGHFWMAANMGALAESFGMCQGLKYRKPIKEALETALRIDPGFQRGSPDRALGRWYFKVPGLFGGSDERAEAHLRASLTYHPQSTASHFFLAELMIDKGRKAEARAELQQVLDAPLDPEWAPEDRDFKDKARRLLGSLK